MTIGFVPSYVLESGVGREVARLKGLESGWHYPTFLLYYVRNPGPLLLFDKIVVDAQAATKAIEYARDHRKRPIHVSMFSPSPYDRRVISDLGPTEREVEILDELVQSDLFQKIDVAEQLTSEDFETIAKEYYRDIRGEFASKDVTSDHSAEFQKAVSFMINKYGLDYTSPDPVRFEAMNLSLTWVISKKLNAQPLDDIYRVPLYETESIGQVSERISQKEIEKAYEVVEQARHVLYLPADPIQNVDEFLDLYKDNRIRSFRSKIQELVNSKADSLEIKREVKEAEDNLKELSFKRYSIAMGFLGLSYAAAGLMSGSFLSGTIGAISGLMPIGNELMNRKKAKIYDWLRLVKGLSENRAS